MTAAQRYRLDDSADWRALLRHFELGTGWAFLVLLVPEVEGERVCRAALERMLREHGQSVLDIPADTPEQLEYVAQTLLDLRPGPEVGAVWLGHVVEEGSPDAELWTEAWRRGVARLNQFRNPLRRAFAIPLIFAGAPKLQVTLRENAPDLWSVRTLVAWVEPAPSEIALERLMPTPERSAYRPDPELAMEEVARLRGVAGAELDVARALRRAGLGYVSQFRWGDAEASFKEALEIHRRVGSAVVDVADVAVTVYEMGKVMMWQLRYEEATELFSIALRAYREVGDVLSGARCIEKLGDVALFQSDHAEARRRYEEALQLYRKLGEVRREAVCIEGLGDIALERSQHVEARRRYEEALPLYRKVGDVLGEANCLKSLGDIALRRSDQAEARRRYDQALPLYRQVGNVLGEANCIRSLGDLALRRSELGEAQRRYEEALQLYRQAGEALGEANCIQGLGNIRLEESDSAGARQLFHEALALYERIAEPYSIGQVHRRLARLTEDPAERDRHVSAARLAWTGIDRADLVAELDREFGTASTA